MITDKQIFETLNFINTNQPGYNAGLLFFTYFTKSKNFLSTQF